MKAAVLLLSLSTLCASADTYSGQILSALERGTFSTSRAIDSVRSTNVLFVNGSGLSVDSSGWMLASGISQSAVVATNYIVNGLCSGATAVTVSMVIRPNTQSNALTVLFIQTMSSIGVTGFTLQLTNGTYLRAGARSDVTDSIVTGSIGTPSQLSTARFSSVCAVFDYANNRGEIYLDGSLVSTGYMGWSRAVYGPQPSYSEPNTHIAGNTLSAGFSPRGVIGNFSLWRRRLTAGEIRELAAGGSP